MTTMFLHPGKRLGSNYELEAIVGTGQFGQVWRARKLNPPSDTPVALIDTISVRLDCFDLDAFIDGYHRFYEAWAGADVDPDLSVPVSQRFGDPPVRA